MNWQDKMIWVIEGVLNEGREDENPYKVKIIDYYNFEVHFNGESIERTQFLNPMSGHWKEIAKKTIIRIMEGRIAAKLRSVE